MSYILDALRRAEAERERGAVPGLQSQQYAIAEDDAVATRPRRLVWAVVALALALIAVLAWALQGRGESTSRLPVEGAVVPAPTPVSPIAPAPTAPTLGSATAPASDSPTTPTVAPTTPSIAPPPRSETHVAPAATHPPAPAARATTPAVSERPHVPPASVAPVERASTRSTAEGKRAQPRGADASASSATASASGAAPTAGAARVYTPAELPEDIRRDLPKVVVSGSSYSGDAASRMIMVNGQVFHEGDRLAPDLVLQRIRQKSAVLSFRGWQYEVLF